MLLFIIQALLAIFAAYLTWWGAPRWLRIVFFCNLAALIAGYIGLRLATLTLDAGKGGSNAGMLSDFAFPMVIMILTLYGMAALSLLLGIVKLFRGDKEISK